MSLQYILYKKNTINTIQLQYTYTLYRRRKKKRNLKLQTKLSTNAKITKFLKMAQKNHRAKVNMDSRSRSHKQIAAYLDSFII